MSSFSLFAIITIIKFRIKDFFKEYNYTILSPLISTLIFVTIFSTIEKYYSIKIDGKSFLEFLIPGLILMVVVQESYDNASNTLVNMKQIGSFNDFLMAPIFRLEIFGAFMFSSIIIGLFLGILNYLVLSFFYNFETLNIILFCYYLILAIIFFSSLGCLIGFVSYSWDTQSSVSNFFVTPINLLSGTFFSINVLPETFKFLFYYNPYYYIVYNFRSSFFINPNFDLNINIFIIFFVFISFLITAFVYLKGFRVIN